MKINIKLFEAVDSEGESCGLIVIPIDSPLSPDELEAKWREYNETDTPISDNSPIDEFVILLNNEGFEVERMFLETLSV